jgi:uncharacterized cupin superfamily protein
MENHLSHRKGSDPMSDIMLTTTTGTLVWLGGLGVNFKLYGDDTGRAFSIVEHPVEPGVLVPPHTHTHEDEFSYVLEGEIGARVGDREVHATPGCYIIKPRGIPHTFWNAGSKPARLLEIISPAGFEKYFVEMSEVLRGERPPDVEKVQEIASRYGLTYQMSWIAELVRKYNLKPPGSRGT